MAGYGDDSGIAAWLEANGYTLPDGAPTPAVLRQRGSVYIDATYGARFKGDPTDGFAKERAWPRTGAVVGAVAIPDDVVPVAVVQASYMAAWAEANSPGSLEATVSASSIVKRERVEGAVEVEYQDAAKATSDAPYDPFAPGPATPILSQVDGLLRPYIVVPLAGLGLWSVGC